MPLSAEEVTDAIRRWAGPLEAWVRLRTNCAEDVVQESFCRLACLDQLPDRVSAWLFHVAANLCREEFRRTSRRSKREQTRAHLDAVDGVAEQELMRVEIRNAVELLEPGLRDAVIARLWGGLTLQESAELHGISITTAHRRYQQALDQLRRVLSDYVS